MQWPYRGSLSQTLLWLGEIESSIYTVKYYFICAFVLTVFLQCIFLSNLNKKFLQKMREKIESENRRDFSVREDKGIIMLTNKSWFWRGSVQFSSSVVSYSLRPHELQHTRPPCPSPTPGVYSNSCPSNWYAIQTSRPLLSPSPPAPNPSQHQGVFNESTLRMR